ncbi:TPA: ParB/RepB/Spo0J family partition protein [Salmonella enterica subsp. salamae serovar 35:g,m,s,t:-]|nr:ParB/RepB/Spo0J family partition protein [Salmonella enterica subsp. salamae serovar 35:g,m,s,t:-]HCA3549710.1 ParB/RepB/Spo0J family partition protein [Salmonella enterica subsp. salamae serovar 35:g,m,s,t:-]
MAGNFKNKLKNKKDQQVQVQQNAEPEQQAQVVRTTEVVDDYLPQENTNNNTLSVIASGALEPDGQIVRVLVEEVYAEEQVRPDEDFDEEFIESLKETYDGIGLLQPPRCFPKDKRGYRIWLGENRVRTAKAKGDKYIDIYVGKPPKNDQDRIIGQLIENIKRSSLKPVATALAFKTLKDKFGMKGADIAKSLGVTTSFVSKHMKLLDAPEKILDLLRKQATTDLDLIYTLCQVNELSVESADKLIQVGLDGQLTRNAVKRELDDLKGRAEEKNKRETERLQNELELRRQEEERRRQEEEKLPHFEDEKNRHVEEQEQDPELGSNLHPQTNSSTVEYQNLSGQKDQDNGANDNAILDGSNDGESDGKDDEPGLSDDIDFNASEAHKVLKKVVRVKIDGVEGYLVLGPEVVVKTADMGEISTPIEDITLIDVVEVEI